MKLADALGKAEPADLDPKFRRHFEGTEDAGVAGTGIVGPEIHSDADLLRQAGLDPDVFEICGKRHVWSKETPQGTRRSFFFPWRRKTDENRRLAELLASKIEPIQPVGRTDHHGDPIVVVLSDAQLGKGEGDGTTGTLRRIESCVSQIAQHLADDQPSDMVIADLGDIVENIFNHTGTPQVITNDLSLDEQIQTAQRVLTQTILTLAPFSRGVTVTGVQSNHGEVRTPSGPTGGDFGIANLRSIQSAFELLGQGIRPRFIIPDDMVHTVRLGGADIALTHGHHAGSPAKFASWVAGQAATPTSPLARASIVIRGHWHSPRVEVACGRWLLGAPTIDPGSKWWRDKTGDWSNPGMLTFRIHDGELSDLRFWEP